MKFLFRFLLFLIAALILFINIRLYSGPDLSDNAAVKEDAIAQLNYLEYKIKNEQLGEEMQREFPEGFLFTNLLYGLSWCELALANPEDTTLCSKALREARFAYAHVNSETGKSIFYEELNPPYGIFYCGWKNYLLGKIAACSKEKNQEEIREFSFNCDEIAGALKSTTPFPDSYPNASWPSDACAALASLKLYDDNIQAKYDSAISGWIKNVKSNLNPDTKMLSHYTESGTGKTIEGARGCSMSLMLRFLADIDPQFALEQFKLYNEKFSCTRFGLPAIREYPEGKSGSGDIDSGPVIFGVGFSASIVAIGTYKKYGETKTADMLSRNIEALGFSIQSNEKKKYIFGMLPIADAFIVWSRTANAKKEIINLKGENKFDFGSQARFHFYSGMIILVICLLLYRKKMKSLFRK